MLANKQGQDNSSFPSGLKNIAITDIIMASSEVGFVPNHH
jgi:hypothetical protein